MRITGKPGQDEEFRDALPRNMAAFVPVNASKHEMLEILNDLSVFLSRFVSTKPIQHFFSHDQPPVPETTITVTPPPEGAGILSKAPR